MNYISGIDVWMAPPGPRARGLRGVWRSKRRVASGIARPDQIISAICRWMVVITSTSCTYGRITNECTSNKEYKATCLNCSVYIYIISIFIFEYIYICSFPLVVCGYNIELICILKVNLVNHIINHIYRYYVACCSKCLFHTNMNGNIYIYI